MKLLANENIGRKQIKVQIQGDKSTMLHCGGN